MCQGEGGDSQDVVGLAETIGIALVEPLNWPLQGNISAVLFPSDRLKAVNVSGFRKHLATAEMIRREVIEKEAGRIERGAVTASYGSIRSIMSSVSTPTFKVIPKPLQGYEAHCHLGCDNLPPKAPVRTLRQQLVDVFDTSHDTLEAVFS